MARRRSSSRREKPDRLGYSSGAYTSEFQHEFQAETDRLLRRRFLWFTAVVGTFGVVGMIVILFIATGANSGLISVRNIPLTLANWLPITLMIVSTGLYVGGFCIAWFRQTPSAALLRASLWIVGIDGVLYILLRALDTSGGGLASFAVSHTVAAIFLPWTPRQALTPAVYVLGLSALSKILYESSPWSVPPAERLEHMGVLGLGIVLSPMAAMPGVFLSGIRHSRRVQQFKVRFIADRYLEVRRELVDARRIHESLFPQPVGDGAVRLSYEYEPMRQIGGDFLFAHRPPNDRAAGALSVVLLDVTGHGIPAALTVNRLHGEMERLFAEEPDIAPGEVLRLLNRYVHLTLANHSIYVTALCLRADPRRGVVEYASGGHPPAFLCAVDGTFEELSSTAFVLGVCPSESFTSEPRTLTFGPGDAIIAYTDGATEAVGREGRMLRVAGLRSFITSTRPASSLDAWPVEIRRRVAEFRLGPAADDTLILAIHRPLRADEPANGSGTRSTTVAVERAR